MLLAHNCNKSTLLIQQK